VSEARAEQPPCEYAGGRHDFRVPLGDGTYRCSAPGCYATGRPTRADKGGGWNYRMFHRRVPDGVGGTTDEFTIREAYYDKRGPDAKVMSWSAEPMAPYGETKLQLMEDVTAMAAAISQPVIALTPDGEHLADEQPASKGSFR
jgi:hypothetical protein